MLLMRKVLPSLLLLLAFGAVAEARDRVAQAVRVTKHGRPAKTHMFWVEQTSQTEALVYALPADLTVGEEFDMIDAQGYVGRIRIKSVEDAYPQCKTTELKKGMASYVTAPSRSGGSDMVALGPNQRPVQSAKVLGTTAPANDTAPAQPNGQLYQRLFMDLDGDGAADLVRDAYSCAQGAQTQQYSSPTYCYDTWGRRGRRGDWTLLTHTQLKYCY